MSATFIEIISSLYAVVFFIGLAGYLPQIINLIKDQSSTKGISLLTWFIWSSSWLISLAYAYLCLEDLKFTLVAAMNLLGHMAVIALVIRGRCQDTRSKSEKYSLPIVKY